MSVCADKEKSEFLDILEDQYNQTVYFVESCRKFPSKFSAEYQLMDLSLNIFFEENNKIVLAGRLMKYCDKEHVKKIKLNDISNEVNLPEINIVNNYLVDDKWEKIDW